MISDQISWGPQSINVIIFNFNYSQSHKKQIITHTVMYEIVYLNDLFIY